MIVLYLLLQFLALAVRSELRLSGAFTNHSVLQRPVSSLGIASTRIFGLALLDEMVYISGSSGFPGPFTVKPNATSNLVPDYGNFSVEIAIDASDSSYPGPYTIYLETRLASNDSVVTSTETLSDIYFGDVFLCSGQSNMEFNIDECTNSDYEKSMANNLPNIRLFQPNHNMSNNTMQNLTSINNGWQIASNDTIGGFSCICWINGRLTAEYLYNETGQKPYIGLIESDIGGTSIHFWAPGNVGQSCNSTGMLPSTGECAEPGAPYYAHPGSIFNSMINPLSMYKKGLSIRTAIWYQGEADSGENDVYTQTAYECELHGLVNGWREQFDIPSMPLIIIQLPAGGVDPYYTPDSDTGDMFTEWSAMQAAQYEVFKMSNNVGLVTIQDQGQGTLHYPYKQIVAERVHLWTRYLTYNDQSVNPNGPQIDSIYKLNGDDLAFYVNFTNYGDGIKLQSAVNCTKLTAQSVFTDTNHTFQCCDMNGVNIIRAKLEGVFWVDHEGHPYPQLWGWMPTNISIVNANTLKAQVLMPSTPGEEWPSSSDKWMRTQTVSIRKMSIGNSQSCVIANSEGIPIAASEGPFDLDVIGDAEDLKDRRWRHRKKIDL